MTDGGALCRMQIKRQCWRQTDRQTDRRDIIIAHSSVPAMFDGLNKTAEV